MTDDSMAPTIKINDYTYIEFNSPLQNNDIGIFNVNNNILIRRFELKKSKLTLKPDNLIYDDIIVSEDDSFNIIGKVFLKT